MSSSGLETNPLLPHNTASHAAHHSHHRHRHQHHPAFSSPLRTSPTMPVDASPTSPTTLDTLSTSLSIPNPSTSSSSSSHTIDPLPSPPSKPIPSTSYPPDSIDPYYTAHWLCFYILGLINNLHYVVVLSAAFSLAQSFDALHLIGVIQWATVILGMVTKAANTLYLLHTSYKLRLAISCATCIIGLCMLTLAHYFSFSFAIVAICLIGAYSAMGESVILGYLRHFHPRLTGAWGAGTGISGVAGTLAYLLLYSVWGLSNSTIFIAITPTCLLYYLAYHYTDTTGPASIALTTPPKPLHRSHATDDTVALISPEATSPTPSTGRFADAWRVALQVKRLCIHLTLVYFLEYVIIVGFASQANPQGEDDSWAYRNAYEILSFCYQLGVLVSRSSISFVQVKRIEWVTAVQALNFVVWFIQAYVGLMPLWLQFAVMVEVGLMGGAMYVNVFYLLRGDEKIKEEERELAINVVSTVYYVGIISSSVVQLVLLNTILTRQQ